MKIFSNYLTALCCLALSGCATFYKPPQQEGGSLNSSIFGTLDESTNPEKPVRAFVIKIDGVRVATEKSARCDFNEVRAVSPGTHVVTVGYSVGKSWTGGLVGSSDFSVQFAPGVKYKVMGQYSGERVGVVWIEGPPTDAANIDRRTIELKDHPQRGIPPGFAAMVDSCLIP